MPENSDSGKLGRDIDPNRYKEYRVSHGKDPRQEKEFIDGIVSNIILLAYKRLPSDSFSEESKKESKE